MFTLQETPIDIKTLRSHTNTTVGAFVCFEGIVRADEHQQSHVSSLHYYADQETCLNEGNLIISQAIKTHQLTHAVCIQRIGLIPVGEIAIWIGAWASHRHNAFDGCRFIIEETKKRLKIWKKEHLNNGRSIWIHGQETSHL